MSKTDMAPAPINLFTSWVPGLQKCCSRAKKSKVEDYSKFSNDDHKHANGKANGLLPVPDFGVSERALSQTSFRDQKSIENVTDWSRVIKKYYAVIRCGHFFF